VLTLSNCNGSVKPVNGVLEEFNGKNEIPYLVYQWKQLWEFKYMYVDRYDMSEYMKQLLWHLGTDLKWEKPMFSL
jgi:hypothetical protein